ncbi:basic helix-loop-helix protein [Mortierella antarctica]|nr:basic helix-loop-helix protein [Mortierella alpina]KAF9985412.1 basic helix-loop-helix protein [Mortierella antarctica]
MTSSSEMNVQEVLDNLTKHADSMERVDIDQTSLTAAIAQHTAAAAVAAAASSPASEATPDQQREQLELLAQQLQQEQENQQRQQQALNSQPQDQHDAATSVHVEEHPVGHIQTLLGGGDSDSMLATVPITPESPVVTKTEKPAPGTDEWHKLRRDNHKEVERRRRENINQGITELSRVVPNSDKNKGVILRQAVRYIYSIKETQERLQAEAAQRDAASSLAQQEREKAIMEKEVAQTQLQSLIAEHEQLKRDFEALKKECEELEESKKRQRTD